MGAVSSHCHGSLFSLSCGKGLCCPLTPAPQIPVGLPGQDNKELNSRQSLVLVVSLQWSFASATRISLEVLSTSAPGVFPSAWPTGRSIPQVYPALGPASGSSPPLLTHHPKAFSSRQMNIAIPPMLPVRRNLALGAEQTTAQRSTVWDEPREPYPLAPAVFIGHIAKFLILSPSDPVAVLLRHALFSVAFRAPHSLSHTLLSSETGQHLFSIPPTSSPVLSTC